MLTGQNRARLVTLALLALAGTWMFDWFHAETGSAALALVGTSLATTLLLLPLRCQLDPCRT